MRRLLLITFVFPPDNLPAATRPGQLYKYLPEYGCGSTVVAGSVHGSSNDDDLVRRVPAGGTCTAVSLVSTFAQWFSRFCIPYEDRLSWVPHAVAAAVQIIKTQPVDAIYSTSPSLAAHFAALWLKARFGLPWIADFQDPVRDNPFRNRHWFYPYDSIIERSFFRYADRVIANTDTVATAWRERYPQWAKKISVLWNSFDPLETIEPGQTRSRSYRVLAHIGSLYEGRHPAQLLASVDRLDIQPFDACVKLIGTIAPDIVAAHGLLFDRLSKRGVLKYGNRSVPREEALRETADADYLVLLDVNEKNTSYQVPSKLLDYVRVGQPILAYTPKDSPVERILARSGIPNITIDPLAPESVCDRKLLQLLRIPPEPRRPSNWFEETFSARTQARIVSELLDEVLRKRNHFAKFRLQNEITK
jgi:glycosyltransferase involved in cell wall biosynthesis